MGQSQFQRVHSLKRPPSQFPPPSTSITSPHSSAIFEPHRHPCRNEYLYDSRCWALTILRSALPLRDINCFWTNSYGLMQTLQEIINYMILKQADVSVEATFQAVSILRSRPKALAICHGRIKPGQGTESLKSAVVIYPEVPSNEAKKDIFGFDMKHLLSGVAAAHTEAGHDFVPEARTDWPYSSSQESLGVQEALSSKRQISSASHCSDHPGFCILDGPGSNLIHPRCPHGYDFARGNECSLVSTHRLPQSPCLRRRPSVPRIHSLRASSLLDICHKSSLPFLSWSNCLELIQGSLRLFTSHLPLSLRCSLLI